MLQITILSILLIASLTGLVVSLKEIIKNDREIRTKKPLTNL